MWGRSAFFSPVRVHVQPRFYCTVNSLIFMGINISVFEKKKHVVGITTFVVLEWVFLIFTGISFPVP